jgi:hypothetical protein
MYFVQDADELCIKWCVTVGRRIKKILFMPGENASDAGLNTREEMHRSLREILYKIEVKICDRFSQLRELELLLFSVQCRISIKPVSPSKS